MSDQIDTAFVKQFKDNLFHLSQQKGSRLRGSVRNESQVGESAFYERLGSSAAIKKTSRHSDTPQIDTPHSRRRVTLEDYEIADLIDEQDKIRLLIDPASAYAQSFMWALGRSADDEIIENAFGTAYAGKEGGTTVALSNSEKLACHDGSETAGSNLNVQTLRAAKRYFDENEVDESINRYMAVSAKALESLLGETEVSSSDFNTVKALVQGEIDTFLGFKFIRTERLLATAATTTYNINDGSVGAGTGTAPIGSRRLMAWAEDGLLFAVGKDMVAKISERSDKSYATQVYACMSMGAVRMEESKFLEVICDEAA
jgi:hypothetical protein